MMGVPDGALDQMGSASHDAECMVGLLTLAGMVIFLLGEYHPYPWLIGAVGASFWVLSLAFGIRERQRKRRAAGGRKESE